MFGLLWHYYILLKLFSFFLIRRTVELPSVPVGLWEARGLYTTMFMWCFNQPGVVPCILPMSEKSIPLLHLICPWEGEGRGCDLEKDLERYLFELPRQEDAVSFCRDWTSSDIAWGHQLAISGRHPEDGNWEGPLTVPLQPWVRSLSVLPCLLIQRFCPPELAAKLYSL